MKTFTGGAAPRGQAPPGNWITSMIREHKKLMWIGSLGCLMVAFVGCKKDKPKPPPASSPAPTAPVALVPEADVTRTVTELTQAWSKVKSFSGRIDSRLADAVGREGRTIGEGTYELRRDGDKLQIRFDLANTLYFQTDWESKSQLVTAEFLLWVTDGTIMYQSTRQTKDYYKVTKTHYNEDALLQLAAPIVLRELMVDHTLKILPEDVLDARRVVVVQATPVNGTWDETHYFDKETGIRVKHVENDKDGKQTYLLTLKDLKVDPEFETNHFDFEVPKEAELIDKTKE